MTGHDLISLGIRFGRLARRLAIAMRMPACMHTCCQRIAHLTVSSQLWRPACMFVALMTTWSIWNEFPRAIQH